MDVSKHEKDIEIEIYIALSWRDVGFAYELSHRGKSQTSASRRGKERVKGKSEKRWSRWRSQQWDNVGHVLGEMCCGEDEWEYMCTKLQDDERLCFWVNLRDSDQQTRTQSSKQLTSTSVW